MVSLFTTEAVIYLLAKYADLTLNGRSQAILSVLGTLPLVFLAEIATAVALGVVLDTMIVRSVLVTAINLDLGGVIWWPSRLDRRPAVTLAPRGAVQRES